METVSPETASEIGRQIIARSNLNLSDDVKNAKEMAPPKKWGEVMAAAYQISVASIASERRASGIVVPALSSEKEFKRRFMTCFRVYAEMRDPRGFRCTHQMSIDFMMRALFYEIHGGPDWRETINPTGTYSPDAVVSYADRVMNS